MVTHDWFPYYPPHLRTMADHLSYCSSTMRTNTISNRDSRNTATSSHRRWLVRILAWWWHRPHRRRGFRDAAMVPAAVAAVPFVFLSIRAPPESVESWLLVDWVLGFCLLMDDQIKWVVVCTKGVAYPLLDCTFNNRPAKKGDRWWLLLIIRV